MPGASLIRICSSRPSARRWAATSSPSTSTGSTGRIGSP